jgi:Zn-dependent peptidase ImmA (M78 family)
MIQRDAMLKAAKLAAHVLDEARAQDRVANGYTRIDPIALADFAGVAVIARPMDKLLGAFLREEQPGILLNTLRPTGMFHMTCAHELGHFHLGHLTTADEVIDYRSDASSFELEADQFAYALMTPMWLLARVFKAQGWGHAAIRDPQVLYQLSLRLGLSYAATIWSLTRIKRLDTNIARTLSTVSPAQIKRSLLPQGATLETNQDVWLLGPADKDAILEPRANDRFVVQLPSHAAAGYLWTAEEAQDVGYTLKPLTIDGPSEPADSDQILVGSRSADRYALEFILPANVEPPKELVNLAFREAQPWQTAQDPGGDALALQAKFEDLKTGLSEGARNRLVGEFGTA